MLTPEYIENLDFNKVVMIYNKLNIVLTENIIERLLNMEDITNTTKQEINKLVETNGQEIFNQSIEKISGISLERKKAVKSLFKEAMKENLNGYEDLFKYRDLPFKLSKSQNQMLKIAISKTDKSLKNFTNTIAFRSKQEYVNAVDKAYIQVVSGSFDYNTVITKTVKELAEKGITLKDKANRDVQLETAVRRNILGGIQETVNLINRDIEQELGCNGYEVTAHEGSRPTHADAQGKQYALSKEDAKKYNIGFWGDVEKIWNDYNCRHTYFGIILGISKPTYSKKELNRINNKSVLYKGKEEPVYKVQQKQRQLESTLRNTKRKIIILEEAGMDSNDEKAKVRKINEQLKKMCKETGLDRKYNREKIAS